MQDEQQMTRRQRRLLKKQEASHMREKQEKKKSSSKFVWLGVLAVLIGGAIYGLQRLAVTTPDTTYTATPVHWHAALELEVCGEHRDLPADGSGSGQAHGRAMVGETLAHHHFDNVMHIEGRIISAEDIALGNFADSIGLTFDADRLMEKVNGDTCAEGGAPGQVKMFVNDEPNTEFRNYIPKAAENAQDQRIRLVFE